MPLTRATSRASAPRPEMDRASRLGGGSRGEPRVASAEALAGLVLAIALASSLGCQGTPLGRAPTPCTRFEVAMRQPGDPPEVFDELDLVAVVAEGAASGTARAELELALEDTTRLLLGGRLTERGPREYRPLTNVRAIVLEADLASTAARAQLVDEARQALGTPGADDPPRLLVMVSIGACNGPDMRAAAADLAARGPWLLGYTACHSELAAALYDLVSAVAGWRCPVGCLFDRRPIAADGRIDCGLFEHLAPGASSTECDRLPGRSFAEVRTDAELGDLTICRIDQLDRRTGESGTVPGWYYDDVSDASERMCSPVGARFVVTRLAAPLVGSTLRFVCLERVRAAPGDGVCTEGNYPSHSPCTVGMRCDPERPGDLCDQRGAPTDAQLRCDAISQHCAYACDSDDDCERAGLAGHLCDLRTTTEAAGSLADRITVERQGELRGVCVSPTCN